MLSLPADRAANSDETPELTCWDGVSPRSLALALARPAIHCADVNVSGDRRRRAPRNGTGQLLGLTVTPRSIYRHSIARIFVDAVGGRLPLSLDLRERLQTAVHEAGMNALLHGIIGIDSRLRDDLPLLATLHEVLEERLSSTDVARGDIRLDAVWNNTKLCVLVRDSGQGFNVSGSPRSGPETSMDARRSGRGLLILEALCDRVAFNRSGTTVKLVFRLSAPDDTVIPDNV